MAIDASFLDLLASCLEYPDPEAAARARAAASGLASTEPELAAALFGLAVFLERAEPGEAEERYTALFDMNPLATLHVGYHVFGDSYPRGEFLAGLTAELRQADVATNGDLPDFLPTVLRLLGKLERDEDRRSLRQLALVPALRRIATALAQSRDPWSGLLRTLPEALGEDGDAAEAGEAAAAPGFLAGEGLGRPPSREPSASAAPPGPQPSAPW